MHCHVGHEFVFKLLPEGLGYRHVASVDGELLAVDILGGGIECGGHDYRLCRPAVLHQMVQNVLCAVAGGIGIVIRRVFAVAVALFALCEPIIFVQAVAVKQI